MFGKKNNSYEFARVCHSYNCLAVAKIGIIFIFANNKSPDDFGLLLFDLHFQGRVIDIHPIGRTKSCHHLTNSLLILRIENC